MSKDQPREDHSEADCDRAHLMAVTAMRRLRRDLHANGIEPAHMLFLLDLNPHTSATSWPTDHEGCCGAMAAQAGLSLIRAAGEDEEGDENGSGKP